MSGVRAGRCVIAGVTVAVAASLAPSANAATIRTAHLDRGGNSIELTVPHRTGARPPAILLSTRPSDADCTVNRYSYLVERRKVRKAPKGKLGLSLRCADVPSGARVRVILRDPFTRTFAITDGVGNVRLRLDKPRGDVLPLAQLTTRPKRTDCRVTRRSSHSTATEFTASARVRCRNLPDDAKGKLAVGGLLSSKRVASQVASATPNARRATKPCSDSRTLSVAGHELTWKYCYTDSVTLGPWQSQSYGGKPNPNCPPGWANATQWPDRATGVILNYLYPADVTVDPSSAWAWSLNWFPVAGWYVTNWQFSGDIVAQWEYNCYKL